MSKKIPQPGTFKFCKKCNIDHEITESFYYFYSNGFLECRKIILNEDRKLRQCEQKKAKHADFLATATQDEINAYYQSKREMSKKTYHGPVSQVKIKRKNSREALNKANRERRLLNRDRDNAKRKERVDNNLHLRLRDRLSKAVGNKIKKQRPLGNMEKWIGCTIHELISHLESQFVDGMSWETYGPQTFHIDHIVPLAFFGDKLEENLHIVLHWKNLRPLWATENRKKKDRMDPWQYTLLEEIKEYVKNNPRG